ncbi:caspase family protein [Streptomyces olivaceoviridis]|uniref:caspase family protein n=1 Tax=Streptomyces olivaceoviridis TaxID=1921 RepID=UPI0037A15B99
MNVEADMPHDDSGGPRRFLIATAVSRYPKCPQWDRPGLVQAREQVINLFAGQLGYRHQTALGLDPTRSQLTDQLRSFCRSPDRREDDLVVLYLSGHGEVLDDGNDHVLFTSDTEPDDIAYTSLPTVELARAMLRDTPVRRLLLILDTCYSAQGGNELTAAALNRINVQWNQVTGSGLVIVSSAQPHQQAQSGLFPQLFADAVSSWATAGHGPQTLSVSTLVEHMNNNPARPAHQRISLTLVGLTGEPPAFLANPRRSSRLTGVDLAIQHAAEFDAQARRRDTELTTRLLMRAMGSSDPRLRSWWFSGRHVALADLADWLRLNAADGRAVCRVVTAGPGSGKTAVLGLIAVLAHPERRRSVPTSTLKLPRRLLPEEGCVDVAIYAQSLTDTDVLVGLAAAAGVRVRTVGEFLEALGHQSRSRPFTALIDALDEAATPDTLCSQILRPLITHSGGRIRLLLGTRPYLLDRLGLDSRAQSYPEQVIDLDDPGYADPEALQAYAIRNLLEAHPASPYRNHPGVLRPVAEAVAEAAGTSFLVARIAASTLAAEGHVVNDPYDPVWRASLPRHAGQAMRNDLTRRLGDEAQRATDLLRPLAFALGQGLPWEDIWAPLASEISGRPYTDDDLMWLRRSAGAYVVEATEADRSAYRLYHQALVEYLRDGIDPVLVHAAYTTVLTRVVPYRPNATRDWSLAHPYTLNYLASHATAAGRLDEVLTDIEYLVHATPRSLTPHLHHAQSGTARLSAAIYRSSLNAHLNAPPVLRRYSLAIDAARAGASSLVDRLNEYSQPHSWVPRWATGSGISPSLRDALVGHFGDVSAVACTTIDGSVAVTSSDDGTVRVWDLTTGTQIGHPLTGHQEPVSAVACTIIDSAPVAVTGGVDGTARVWDLTTGTQIGQPLTGHDAVVRAVACTVIDGDPVAITGSWDGTVRVWDLTTGTQIGQPFTGHEGAVNAVACTVIDGDPVAITGGLNGKCVTWNLATRTQLGQSLTGHEGAVNAVACTTLGGTPVAITGGHDGTARAWDLTTGTQIGQPFTGHEGAVNAVACTTLGGTPVAITGGHDGTVRVWDLTTATHIRNPRTRIGGLVQAWDLATDAGQLTDTSGAVRAVSCTVIEGTPVAITGGDDRTVRVWELTAVAQIGLPLTGHDRFVYAVACTVIDSDPVAVTGGHDGTVRLWDLATGTQIEQPLTGHEGAVNAVACTVINGTPVAVSGGVDSTVRVWDLTTRTQIGQPLTGHSRSVRAVGCAVIDRTPVAITGGWDGTVRLWDLTTRTQIGQPFTGHEGLVEAVACNVVDGRPVAITGSYNGTVRLWDLTTRTQIGQLFTGHEGAVNAVACTVIDGAPLAVTGDDRSVRVWDLATGKNIGQPIPSQGGPVRALACTIIDGTPVAVVGGDGMKAWVCDLATGRQTGQPLTGHGGPVRALACTITDGTPVAVVGGDDKTVRVWDLAIGRQIGQPLTGHTGFVNATACTVIDGNPVAITGGDDRTLRVWDLTTGEHIGQPLTSHGGPVRALACTIIDGTPVAIAGVSDGTVRMRDLANGTRFGQVLTGHEEPVNAVACTRIDGRPMAITGGDDGTVRVWDLTTGTQNGQPLTGHEEPVNAVASTMIDGIPVAVTSSGDNTVRLWNLTTGQSCVVAMLSQPRVAVFGSDSSILLATGSDLVVFGREMWSRRRRS